MCTILTSQRGAEGIYFFIDSGICAELLQETFVMLNKALTLEILITISEFESGDIVIYDISVMPAIELSRIETGFNSLQGIKIGLEGKIWGVDYDSDMVFRVDDAALSANDVEITQPVIYPNPTSGDIRIVQIDAGANLQLFDMQGKLLRQVRNTGNSAELDMNGLESGIYMLNVIYANGFVSKKIVKL